MEIVNKTQHRRRAHPTFDPQRIAQALKMKGIDTRTFVEVGTVGVLNDQGDFVVEDGRAIYPEPDGVFVDVRLDDLGFVITGRFHGLACGRFGSILVPIFQGDEVQVLIPGGEFGSSSITVELRGANATAPIPTDWGNDPTPRVLFNLKVPLEIRGPSIKMDSPNMVLNGRGVIRGPENI